MVSYRLGIFYTFLFPELERAKTDPMARLKKMNLETKEALAELEKTYKSSDIEINVTKSGKKADKWNAASYLTGEFVKHICQNGL